MALDHNLLRDFVKVYPAQPATAYWRAIEIGALLRQPLPTGCGLDLGCGDGKLTKIILNRSGPRKLIGIDVDQKETDIARQLGIYEDILTTEARSIPLPSESIDFVISNSVMEHIPDLNAVITEVCRILRTGGILITTVPTIGFHANLRGSVLPWIKRQDYLTKLDTRLAHFHYLTTRDWANLLDRNGMRLKHRFGYLDRAECRRWETLSRFTGGLLHSMSFGRRSPIEIQRSLGLRMLQTRHNMPEALTALISNVIASQRSQPPRYWYSNEGLGDSGAGCLVIVAERL